MHKLNMREIMWAEMSPDVYDGPNCDQIRPDWVVSEVGSKSPPTSEGGLLELLARTFPPGTLVTISIPECPECEQEADACDCGFDWTEWTLNEYS